jgi:hypothetical protein
MEPPRAAHVLELGQPDTPSTSALGLILMVRAQPPSSRRGGGRSQSPPSHRSSRKSGGERDRSGGRSGGGKHRGGGGGGGTTTSSSGGGGSSGQARGGRSRSRAYNLCTRQRDVFELQRRYPSLHISVTPISQRSLPPPSTLRRDCWARQVTHKAAAALQQDFARMTSLWLEQYPEDCPMHTSTPLTVCVNPRPQLSSRVERPQMVLTRKWSVRCVCVPIFNVIDSYSATFWVV